MTARWTPPSFAGGPVDGNLWNALVALSGEPLPIGEAGASFSFSLCETPSAAAYAAEVATARLPRPFILHVKQFPFSTLFDVDLDVADLGDLPDGLKQALFEGMFSSIREQIGGGRLEGLTLGRQGLASGFAGYGSSQYQWFDVTLNRAEGDVVEMSLCAERAAIVELLGDVLGSGTPLQAALAQNLTVEADITLGSIALKLADRNALRAGAVVVMAERPEGSVMVRFRERIFDFARAEDGWCCQRVRAVEPDRAGIVERDSERAMHDEEAPAVKDAPVSGDVQDFMDESAIEGGLAIEEPVSIEKPVSIGDIAITIDFDLGRLQLPLSEISQWRQGAVVALDHTDVRSGLPVTIRANGRVVGSGDVVRIDDRIAVRITELYIKE